MLDIHSSSNDHLDLQIILETVFASLATHTRMLKATETRNGPQSAIPDDYHRSGGTHGVAAFETTPVLIATIPKCNCSAILVARFMFSVNRYDARPTSQSFAVGITSSSFSNWKIGAIGPKISSLHTRMFLLTLDRIVGSKKFGPKSKLDLY